MLKCKNCGADVRFDPETQKYVCDFCDSVWNHDELNDDQKSGDIKAEEQKGYGSKDDEFIEVITFTCPQCGGELFTTDETAATFCSFCGASVLLEKRVSKELKPEFIIPFTVTKEQAAEIYKKKVNGAIFAPSYMRHMDIEKVRGIYMPYWTYEAMGNAIVSAKKTVSTPVVGGTKVDEYKVDASIFMKGNGIEYDSASSFPDDLSQAIAPYDFKEAKKFDASYMSGFYADAGDVQEEVYYKEASNVMTELGIDKAAKEMNVSKGQLVKQMPELIVDGKRAMYPVWFISARNKMNNKVSYAVVNGQSGKIAADIPVDNKRLIIGTLAIALPIFALLFLIATPTPVVATWIFLALSAIGAIMTIRNMVGVESGVGAVVPSVFALLIPIAVGALGIFIHQVALISAAIPLAIALVVNLVKKVKNVKVTPQQIYILPLILCILSVVACVVALIINPVRDMIFYIFMIISGVLLGSSYWAMFNIHNKSTLRKLPQLGKRGGDE